MPTRERRALQLVTVYEAADACAAPLLGHRRPAYVVAFTIIEEDLSSRDVTFCELREAANRFAGALAGLGIGESDRVATLMGKSLELVLLNTVTDTATEPVAVGGDGTLIELTGR
ncbi:MAG: acetyl-CoA synthetase [Pseudonocardiales bacterium]|jgi:acetyl-CoA synthetase|nr:acetyl-CoA synthetase [Pseudonocardiales bacterium]